MMPRLRELAERTRDRRRPRARRDDGHRDRRAGHATADAAEAGRIASACHEHGVLVLTCGTYSNVLRFLPPLVISDALLEEALGVLAEALDA